MRETKTIGLVEAQAAVKAMLDEAAKGGRPMSVAVVDAWGDLLAFARMDGATALTARMSQNKAYTAVSFGMDTRMFFGWLKDADKDIAWYDDHRLTAVYGGLVVRTKEGIPIGAVGTSGRRQEEDEELAMVGKKAIEAML
jgi:glc operon protein GlcG